MKASLDIIIVNWNAGAQLKKCVDSIAAAVRDEFELLRVVVVDNASSDSSADRPLSTRLPLTVVLNESNRGFAAACNQGAQGSRASYLLFLNPDTTLFADSLAAPISYMEQPEHIGVGIVGIQLVNGDHTVSRSCARFPTPSQMISTALGLTRLSPRAFRGYRMEEWDHLDTREVDHVMGAFLMVRRTVFERLGGFDERFFVYLEDLDFSLRASHIRVSSHYLASAKAGHTGGGCSQKAKAQRLFYSLRSRILYCRKHFSRTSAAAVTLATLFVEPFLRIAYASWSVGWDEMRDTIAAYTMLIRCWGRSLNSDRTAQRRPLGPRERLSSTQPRVWLVVSSCRNDNDVIRILEQVESGDPTVFERVLVVDSEGTGAIPSFLADRGWQHVIYRSYPNNLGSGANLCERLRIAAEGGADYAYALNHDGNFDTEVFHALLDAVRALEDIGAAYPLSYLTTTQRFNLTGTRELPLPAKLVAFPPAASLIDAFWSSSNGALYSTAPARNGILPWAAMWMGWEDLEYGWRLKDCGYRQVIVPAATYRDNYEYRKTWMGKTIDKPPWRNYYNFRNLILAVRRTRNSPIYYAAIVYRVLLECGLILLVRDCKLARLRSLYQGTIDGLRQELENPALRFGPPAKECVPPAAMNAAIEQ